MSPNQQKSHIQILVSMLNEKNKYIKVLHQKVDNLNEMIQLYQKSPAKFYRVDKHDVADGNIRDEDQPLIVTMKTNFEKALNSLDMMKLQNMQVFKEIFIQHINTEEDEIEENVVESSLEEFEEDKQQFAREDSYQDYLNNADLDPAKSEDKKKKGLKSKKGSIGSMRTASQKNTARGAQTSMGNPQSKQPTQLRSHIPTYRPPTSSQLSKKPLQPKR